MRHKRSCPCARTECSGACGKSKGDFQKMAAFHDIFLSVRRVMPREFRRLEMNDR
jgi:hypothetical protein